MSLFSPQPNVENMLWFRLFFHHHSANRFVLKDDPNRESTPPPSSDWTHDELPEELKAKIQAIEKAATEPPATEVAPNDGVADRLTDSVETLEHAEQ